MFHFSQLTRKNKAVYRLPCGGRLGSESPKSALKGKMEQTNRPTQWLIGRVVHDENRAVKKKNLENFW